MVTFTTGNIGIGGGWFITAGICAIVIGGAVVLFPSTALRILLLAIGFFLLVMAVAGLAGAAIIARYRGIWIVPAALGVIALMLSLMSFMDPNFLASVIVVLVAIIVVVAGIIALFIGFHFRNSRPSMVGAIATGILLVVAGILMVLYKGLTSILMVQALGILLILAGIIAVATGISHMKTAPRVITITPEKP
jgi:uncharacterized membrane protein HdeD (DUF308 family)